MPLPLRLFSSVCAVLAACTQTHNLATSAAREAGSGDAEAPDAGGPFDPPDAGDAGTPFTFDAGVVYCGGRPCECSNGKDDDGDGRTDGFDYECTGAFDDVERDFATGVADDSRMPKCQDCYFDVIPGRDACNRATSCATEGIASEGTGACRSCVVPSSCADHCVRFAPNGCDCFGCCEVFRGEQRFPILLRAGCTLDALEDSARCTRCVPATDCWNRCDDCELCPGRTIDDLPPQCGMQFGCEGSTVCTQSSDCQAGEFCQFGCCITIVI